MWYLWHRVSVLEWALWVTTLKVPHIHFPISQLPGLGPRQGPVALGVTAAVRPACALQMVDSLPQAGHAHSHSPWSWCPQRAMCINASMTRPRLQQSPQLSAAQQKVAVCCPWRSPGPGAVLHSSPLPDTASAFVAVPSSHIPQPTVSS